MGKKKKQGGGAAKTLAKTEKNAMKKLSKLKGEIDLPSLIADHAEKKKISEAKEVKCDIPSARSGCTLVPHPDKEQLFLFGGELFNGRTVTMYDNLYLYDIKKNEWREMEMPLSPSPRSSHQMVAVCGGGGQLWMFGGEFASSNYKQFHHYKDLWVYHISQRKWEKINATGGPSARSGHRMVQYKKLLIVFGGFYDNQASCIYFNDVHLFSMETYSWISATLNGSPPAPRSGCCMMNPDEGQYGLLVWGGYSKKMLKKEVEQGVTHVDMFSLRPETDQPACSRWQWSLVKQRGEVPSPRSSSGCASNSTSQMAYIFGGIYDVDEDEDDVCGRCLNDLFSFNVAKQRWQSIVVSSVSQKSKRPKKDKLEVAANVCMELEEGVEEMEISDATDLTPCERMRPVVCIKKGIMYLYGGIIEDGDKQNPLADLFALNLQKLDRWKQLDAAKAKVVWLDSESESGSEDDSEEEDEDEDVDEEGQDCSDIPPSKSGESISEYFGRNRDFWLDKAEEKSMSMNQDLPMKQLRKMALQMASEYLANHSH